MATILIFQGGAVVWIGLLLVYLFGGRQLLDFQFIQNESTLSRSSFPDDFLFGASSSAYQYEGAAKDGGRGPSIWDTFTHQQPDKIIDHSNGDVAIDFYHRYKEDMQMLKEFEVGMDAFRFSISWSRLLPSGKISGGVNEDGIKFYNNVIDELISKGIKPFVTLFHWDVPQRLEDEYGGFLHMNIVNDYRDYAELCFKEFGDRVKHWITLNEPSLFSKFGYDLGTCAPGRCSNYSGNCTKGNSATEPYIVGHHQILAHSAAVKVYKEKYQISQKGVIGITLTSKWYISKSVVPDLNAANRAIDFDLGWILHPLVYGDYPSIMRSYVSKRLPEFTEEESRMLKEYTNDFIGLNYYTSNYASSTLSIRTDNLSYSFDSLVDLSTEENGIPIGEPTALSWLFICPNGIGNLVLYIKNQYNNPTIYITENGMADQDDTTLPVCEAIKDDRRIKFFHKHLSSLQKAIKDGANVKGHFAWSLFDDFEWVSGFSIRFGINYVDYKDGMKRYPKRSASWYRNFLVKASK